MMADNVSGMLLSHAQDLVQLALAKAREVRTFQWRWRMIASRMEQIPHLLSQLSSHPYFSKNALCSEQLQAVKKTMEEAMDLAQQCLEERTEGKLMIQSCLDSLCGKLDLHLRDCGLLARSGVLGETTAAEKSKARESLARLQLGSLEAKEIALDRLMEIVKEDEKDVISAVGQSNISALVQLLAGASPSRVREKTIGVVCSLVESGICEKFVSEGVIPPLIKLAEAGGAVAKKKATICLGKLSMSREAAELIIILGGVSPLISSSMSIDSDLRSSAISALRNLSVLPEQRQILVHEGIIQAMIHVIDFGNSDESKEHAAECLQHLAVSNDDIRRSIISQGGIRSLISYLAAPSPKESGICALKNLIRSTTTDSTLRSRDLLPRLVHVLKKGTPGAQRAAASTICHICCSSEEKRLAGEAGCIPPLVKMLDAKNAISREVSAQALWILMTVARNRGEIRRDGRIVASLVQLLDPSAESTAKKYAIACLSSLSSCKKCRKMMISHGAIGYLKKLLENEVPGAKKLQDRLERRGGFSFNRFFGRRKN